MFQYIMLILFPIISFAGVYITPFEYDNLYLSNQSEGFAYIKNNTALLSGNNYSLGGQSVKYKCGTVPKISCAIYSPDITASISEVSMRHPTENKILNNYSTDLRIEEDANNWYVCGAGYAGTVYDTSYLTSTTNSSGATLKYTYKPNDVEESYLYFTNQANSSSSSYLIIRYKQICR